MKHLLLITILATATIFASCTHNTTPIETPINNSGATQTESTQTTDAANEFFTYTNDEYGFSIDLPKTFKTTTPTISINPKSSIPHIDIDAESASLSFMFYSDNWQTNTTPFTISIFSNQAWDELMAICEATDTSILP